MSKRKAEGDDTIRLSESERADLHAFNEQVVTSSYLEVGGVRINAASSTADFEEAIARHHVGHRLSAHSEKGANTRSGPSAHRASIILLDLLRHLLVARLNPLVKGRVPSWGTWWPTEEDHEAALRALRAAVRDSGGREKGWQRCIDAVAGYVDSFTGNGRVSVAELVADVLGFAAIGVDVRRRLKPLYHALVSDARMQLDLFMVDFRPTDLLDDAEVIATARERGLLATHRYPVEWQPLLDVQRLSDLPDPLEPFVGEKPTEIAGAIISGMPDIAAAVAKRLGRPALSARRVPGHLKKAGILLRKDGGRKFIYSADLDRIERPSEASDTSGRSRTPQTP